MQTFISNEQSYDTIYAMSIHLSIRQSSAAEDLTLAQNYYLMWQDYDMQDQLEKDWQVDTLAFIQEARAKHELVAFVAEQDGVIVGSAVAQVFQGLYPQVFHTRKYGYIWGVYVAPEARKKGIATQLTRACNEYLKEIGCTKVVLHAAPMAKCIYEKLGFTPSNEMILEF